ncbi:MULTISPECIES: VasL domain-containing protein [Photorhabdus]|nr:VasL domain-containing protein [Photorhabdus thracensis]
MVRETAARVQPQVNVVRVLPVPRWKVWHGFVAGVALCALAVTSVWWVKGMRQAPPLAQTLQVTTQPLPRTLLPAQLAELRHPDNAVLLNQLQEKTLAASRSQLASLDTLPVLWRLTYGVQLLHQLRTLWPAKRCERWRNSGNSNVKLQRYLSLNWKITTWLNRVCND